MLRTQRRYRNTDLVHPSSHPPTIQGPCRRAYRAASSAHRPVQPRQRAVLRRALGTQPGRAGQALGAGRVRGHVWGPLGVQAAGSSSGQRLGCPWGAPTLTEHCSAQEGSAGSCLDTGWDLHPTANLGPCSRHPTASPSPAPHCSPRCQHQQSAARHSPLPGSPSHRTDRATPIYKGE